MNLITYDLTFLVLFAILVSIFLYRGKKNLKKEGILLLYKASWGIKLINYVGTKYKRTLDFLSYVSITMGYLLMVVMLYLLGKIVWIYLFVPSAVKAVKVPPIMPLIPYLPQLFKLDFLPPFYFAYWIIILAVIAIPHEFAHGIFARRNNIRIKSTGFGFFPFFLPVFLAAFVEQDEEDMKGKSKFAQLAVLSAGTFANVLTAIFFFVILWGFFSLAFIPAGITFDAYPYEMVATSGIISVNGVMINNASLERVLDLSDDSGFNEIQTDGGNYLATKDILAGQIENADNLVLFIDGPAIKVGLEGIISEINGEQILSIDDLSNTLDKYSPGQEVTLSILEEDGTNYNIDLILEAHPDSPEKSWLGVGFSDRTGRGIMGKMTEVLGQFKKPNVHYVAKWDGWSVFIYDLLWWLVLICISVALVNMLPVGIFDGGMFFYLTVWQLTGSEKVAKKLFSIVTYAFLFLIVLLMVFWAKAFF